MSDRGHLPGPHAVMWEGDRSGAGALPWSTGLTGVARSPWRSRRADGHNPCCPSSEVPLRELIVAAAPTRHDRTGHHVRETIRDGFKPGRDARLHSGDSTARARRERERFGPSTGAAAGPSREAATRGHGFQGIGSRRNRVGSGESS